MNSYKLIGSHDSNSGFVLTDLTATPLGTNAPPVGMELTTQAQPQLSRDGGILGSVRIEKVQSFSGWRVATDRRGHVYVAGMVFGEPGYPLVVEFDATLTEVGRQILDARSPVFIRSLWVSPNGKDMVLAGTASRRWMGNPTQGPSDAFILRCHRADSRPSSLNLIDLPEIKPRRAGDSTAPW